MSCNVKKVVTTSKNKLVRKLVKEIEKANLNYSKAIDIIAVAVNEGFYIGKVTLLCDFITDNHEEELKYIFTKDDLRLYYRFGILGESDKDYIASKEWFDKIK